MDTPCYDSPMKITSTENELTLRDAGIARIIIDTTLVVFSIVVIIWSWLASPFGTGANIIASVVLTTLAVVLIVSIIRSKSWHVRLVKTGVCVVRQKGLFNQADVLEFDYSDAERLSVEFRTFRGVTTCHVELELKRQGWRTILDTKTYDPFFSRASLSDQLSDFLNVPQTSERAIQRSQQSLFNKRLF